MAPVVGVDAAAAVDAEDVAEDVAAAAGVADSVAVHEDVPQDDAPGDVTCV